MHVQYPMHFTLNHMFYMFQKKRNKMKSTKMGERALKWNKTETD